MEFYIPAKLTNLFPEKTVEGLSATYPGLYQLIGASAREKNQTIREYLEDLGFTYVTKQRGVQSSFDAETAKLLINEFGISQSDLAEWQGISRQAISAKINNHTQGKSWITHELNMEEQAVVKDMIENRIFTVQSEGLTVAIRSNYHLAALIIINEDETKVIFDFPEEIQKDILQQQLDIFTEIDFEIKEGLTPVIIMGEKYATGETSIRTKVRQQSRKRGITEEEYCLLHGYKGLADTRTATDEEIIEIISQYVVEKNYVYIPHDSEHYFNFTNRAHRANMNIEEYFEFYGFIKVDSRLGSSYQKKIEEYKREIRQCLIEGSEVKVLLKSDTPLYRKLYPFAKRRGITIEDFLKDLGFERVFSSDNVVTFANQSDSIPVDKRAIYLAELENIQGNMERETSQTEQVKRNKQLVKRLKELYHYQCQLCGTNHAIPLIEKEDGTNYVEVHHIKALSTAGLPDQEGNEFDDQLDHYSNAIVVCPFHHKVLHYHHGGFNRIIEQNSELYFFSKKESLLKVERNFHLSGE